MRVLIVKTSSLGDVIHTLPALTDAARAIPGITFDWMVEESFSEIPPWHPAVRKVIPMAWRRWRKKIWSADNRQEWQAFLRELRKEDYDLIIDAQGLVKSALLSLTAKGKRSGLDWGSAREPFASVFYNKKSKVNFCQHAVIRMRAIVGQSLGYPVPDTIADYGIGREQFADAEQDSQYLVFLHSTTWETKMWPESYWQQLANLAATAGLKVKMLWGNAPEKARAERVAAGAPNIEVVGTQFKLNTSVRILANAQAVVAVDTGLLHLAAALNVPTVSLYGPTNPEYTGAMGQNQIHLAANFPCAPCLKRDCTYPGEAAVQPPCFSVLSPRKVWEVFNSSR